MGLNITEVYVFSILQWNVLEKNRDDPVCLNIITKRGVGYTILTNNIELIRETLICFGCFVVFKYLL